MASKEVSGGSVVFCPLQRGGSPTGWAPRVFCRGGQSFISQSKRPRGLSTWEGTQAKGFNAEKVRVLRGSFMGRWVRHAMREQGGHRPIRHMDQVTRAETQPEPVLLGCIPTSRGPERWGYAAPSLCSGGRDAVPPHFLPSWRASNEYEPAPRQAPHCGITWSLMLLHGSLGAPAPCLPRGDGCYLYPGLALISGRISHQKLACHGKQLKEKNKPQRNLRVLGNEELQGGGMKKLYKNLFLHHNNMLFYG